MLNSNNIKDFIENNKMFKFNITIEDSYERS
jgi:hypothetical protein